MQKSTLKNQCPALDKISDFFDKRLDLHCREYHHIENCAECQKILNSYLMIQKYCQKKSNISNNELITSNIRKVFWEQHRIPHKKILFFRPAFIAAAAGLIVAAGAGLLVLLQSAAPIHQNNANTNHPEMTAAHISSMKFPYYTGKEYLSGKDNAAIPAHSLIGANFGNGFSPVFISEKKLSGAKPVEIASNVRQVWIGSNSKSSKDKLFQALKRAGISASDTTQANGNTQLQIVLTKGQLVDFVKDCTHAGFDLLSPQAPQPEQHQFFGNANDPVYYSMEIVPDK
jgi:hypothetical protein